MSEELKKKPYDGCEGSSQQEEGSLAISVYQLQPEELIGHVGVGLLLHHHLLVFSQLYLHHYHTQVPGIVKSDEMRSDQII